MKVVLDEHKYDVPVLSREHETFCKQEAERRYGGKLIRDGEMLLVEDARGVCHTDKVLRALSFYKDSGDVGVDIIPARSDDVSYADAYRLSVAVRP